MKVILTEDQVLKAIDVYVDKVTFGLCACFEGVRFQSSLRTLDDDSYTWIPLLLCALGGGGPGSHVASDGAYFWSYDEEGENARAMFLAFMLEWARQ